MNLQKKTCVEKKNVYKDAFRFWKKMKNINIFRLALMTLFLGEICSMTVVSAQVYSEESALEWVVFGDENANIPNPTIDDSGNTEWTLGEIFPEESPAKPTVPSQSLLSPKTTFENVHSTAPISTTLKTKTNLVTTIPNSVVKTPVAQKTTLDAMTKTTAPQVSKPKNVANTVRNTSNPVPQSSVKSKSTNQNWGSSDLVIVTPKIIEFRTRLQSWNDIENDISTYRIALFFRKIGAGIQMLFLALLGMIIAIVLRDFRKIRKFVFDRVEFRVPIRIKTK